MAEPADGSGQRAEDIKLYELAVAEYRFQVQLNWDRSKYLLGFNATVIGVGTGLVQVGDEVTRLLLGIFLVGLVSAALSAIAVSLQHGYYEHTRDTMIAQGARLGLDDRAVASTPGARGGRAHRWQRLGRVQTILHVLLAVCAVVDIFGIVFVATR